MVDVASETAIDFVKRQYDIYLKDENVSTAIASVKALLELIRTGTASTVSELDINLKKAIDTLKSGDELNVSPISIQSISELFMRFIIDISDERRDNFDECKKLMLERGDRFVKKAESSIQKIAKLAAQHIPENCTILVHSHSRVVLEVLRFAATSNRKFKVFVTASAPDGQRMINKLELLKSRGIDAELIPDASIAYYMESVNLVLVGAEAVLGNGGIINKMGTLTLAMVAKCYNKPFYVATESFKFSNRFLLSQDELTRLNLATEKDASKTTPKIDYTPSEYITLLFTDIGILTTTAVSDELIKLNL